MEKTTKILILGTGFGGMYTAKYLHCLLHDDKNVELALVGERNYFLFTPLLHEVATGGLSPGNIIEPIRKILGCGLDKFYLGRAEEIDLANKTVKVGQDNLPYDYLVIATGAETNFYNIPGAENNSFALKSMGCAVRLKNHIIVQVENAAKVSDRERRRKMLRFAIIGGGPTGVELAAEMEEFLKETFAHYYAPEIIEDISIVLVHRDKELVPQFGSKIRAKSEDVLIKKGVKLLLGSSVKEMGADFVALENGTRIDTETIVWVAGIKPNLPTIKQPIERAPDGKLLVNEFFQVKEYPEVFAVGDVAAFPHQGKYLPALAQVAEKEARGLAVNLARLIKGNKMYPFRYKHSGNLISLGEWMAAGEIGKFTFSGRFAWWLWRTVYLFKFISGKKKLLVAIDWTINLFLPRDISEL